VEHAAQLRKLARQSRRIALTSPTSLARELAQIAHEYDESAAHLEGIDGSRVDRRHHVPPLTKEDDVII
jgi:hypothetical protein